MMNLTVENKSPYRVNCQFDFSNFLKQPLMAPFLFTNCTKMSVLVPRFVVVSSILLLSISWHQQIVLAEAPYQAYKVEVVNEFPHDPEAYTQGLLYAENDTLFESTGLYGQSSVRKVALRTGKVVAIHEMQSSYFGEGLTLLGERLFQLTWLQETGFIYDRYNLSKFRKFSHKMQDGWGLATDEGVLFRSDGTSTLYEIDPQTMKVIRKQVVKSQGHEVHYLNELEYVNGEVWANVYVTDCIARISPKDGSVLGWILLKSLREDLISRGYKNFEVLNGIAWDKHGDRIFVTGKLWPKMFEIKLLPLQLNAPLIGDINKLCIPPYHGKSES